MIPITGPYCINKAKQMSQNEVTRKYQIMPHTEEAGDKCVSHRGFTNREGALLHNYCRRGFVLFGRAY